MRILGSIVAPSTTLMAFCDSKITGCGSIRSQIIRDELVWDKAIFLQKLAHEFQRRTLVPPALDQHIKENKPETRHPLSLQRQHQRGDPGSLQA